MRQFKFLVKETALSAVPLATKRHVKPIKRVKELCSGGGRRLIYSHNPNRTVPNKSRHLSVRHCLTWPTRPGGGAAVRRCDELRGAPASPYLGDSAARLQFR